MKDYRNKKDRYKLLQRLPHSQLLKLDIEYIIKDVEEGVKTKEIAIMELMNIESEEAISAIHYLKGKTNIMEKKLKEIIDLDVIAWRDEMSKLIQDIKKHKQNRITSLVITKLEEAQMWAGNLFSVGKRDGIIKRK